MRKRFTRGNARRNRPGSRRYNPRRGTGLDFNQKGRRNSRGGLNLLG